MDKEYLITSFNKYYKYTRIVAIIGISIYLILTIFNLTTNNTVDIIATVSYLVGFIAVIQTVILYVLIKIMKRKK